MSQEFYVVRLSWFDEFASDEDNLYRHGDDVYFFSDMKQAIDFAYNISSTEIGKEYDNPKDVYVYAKHTVKNDQGQVFVPIREDDTYLLAFYDADKKLKIHSPRVEDDVHYNYLDA